MSRLRNRHLTRTSKLAIALLTATTAAVAGQFALRTHRAGAASIGQLRSQLDATNAAQTGLGASLANLDRRIGDLTAQIALVQRREVAVRATLAADTHRLGQVLVAVAHERRRAAMLQRRLARARRILAAQLVSRYESAPPSLLSVVVDARGFNQLLDQLRFLGDAEQMQQTAITVTKAAKLAANAEAVRLTRLARADARVTRAFAIEAGALAGMNTLLDSREALLATARSAQESALASARGRGVRLRAAIAQAQAAQAAAARAAALRAQELRAHSLGPAPALGPTPALTPSAGWAIPYPIVLCESGGQNLPPNGSGASGYYQIIPSTWRQFGGSGPAAYLASKAAQDAVAARIWNGGAGASDWACSAMVSGG